MSDHNHDVDMDEVYILPKHKVVLEDFECGDDWILDIGAGGEGIIELLKGRQVVGIDRSKKDMEGTSNEALKIIMDACDLMFLDETFTTATAFYTLMYIPWENLDTVFAEVSRVLKPQGQFLVWDTHVKVPPSEKDKKYFLTMMTVAFPDGTTVESGFGSPIRSQSVGDFVKIAKSHGFSVVEKEKGECAFFLRLRKES